MAEKLVPKDRAEWLSYRKNDVTAGDIACLIKPPNVLDEHPHITPLELFNAKTGRPTPSHGNATTERGNDLEEVGVKRLRRKLPNATIEYNMDPDTNLPKFYLRDPTLRIGATLDVSVDDPKRGKGTVDIKSLEPSIFAKKCQDGEPPLWMALQAITQAKLSGAQWAALGILRVRYAVEFDLFEVPLSENAWNALTDAVGEFWRCVETDTPPVPNYKRDLAVISAMYPMDDGTTVDLSHDNELIHALVERERVKEMIKAAQDNCDAYDALIKHKAGVHELIIAGDYRCVLKTQQISGYVVKPRIQRSLRIKKLGALRPRAGEAAA